MIRTILNLPFNNKFIFIFSIIFFFSLNSHAQLFSSKNRKKRNKNIPTIIKSDSMDFDISKNVAVFTGNVQVDDAEMRIFCHKMIIIFEGNIKDRKGAEEAKKSDVKTNQKVKEIICLKNVVIIRKLEKSEKGKEQKALGGKAVYDVKAGKITLTINPELQNGEDTLVGKVIEFWTDSERVNVHGGGIIKINSETNED